MIFRNASIGNPWRNSANVFLIFNLLSVMGFWIAYDISGYDKFFINICFFLVIFLYFLLFLIGTIFHTVARIKYFIIIMGAFAVAPILFFSIVPVILFLILSSFSFGLKTLVMSIYVGVAIYWALLKITETVKLDKEFSYLRGEIKINDQIAYIERDKINDLSFLKKNSPSNMITHRIIPKLLPLTLLGYPLQRIVTDAGGNSATMAFISLLTIPLSIYFMGRISSGYYLWVHLIGGIEKKIGKKIYLWDISKSDR